jgi:sodium/hydrogen antiporter
MHQHHLLIFCALLIFSSGLAARISEQKYVTGPMTFMTVGILASGLAFSLFELHYEIEPVKLVAELAFA